MMLLLLLLLLLYCNYCYCCCCCCCYSWQILLICQHKPSSLACIMRMRGPFLGTNTPTSKAPKLALIPILYMGEKERRGRERADGERMGDWGDERGGRRGRERGERNEGRGGVKQERR